jgi:hypothetical protein
MGSKVDKSIQDTGIMSGGVAIGAKSANAELKIKVLFDWKPGNGGSIPGPFELNEVLWITRQDSTGYLVG